MKSYRPESFVSLPYDVFASAYIDTVISTARRLANKEEWIAFDNTSVELTVCPLRFRINEVSDLDEFRKLGSFKEWTADKGFLILSSSGELKLIRRMQATGAVMNDFVEVMRGVESFHPSKKAGLENPVLAHTGALLRYQLTSDERLYFDYTADIESSKPRRFFSGPRILLRQLISRRFRLQAMFAEELLITNQSIQSLVSKGEEVPLLVVLGILNSRLMSWYFCQVNTVARRDDFPKTIIKTTRQLPMPRDLGSKGNSDIRSKLTDLVSKMVNLCNRSVTAKTSHERTAIERQIAATDRQIDGLVYELYGLTDDEIKIIEQATLPK